jgi:acyl-CoA thioester hydrolase
MHERRVDIRWSDLDAYAHVYHPVYLGYMEEARDEWLGRLFGDGDGDGDGGGPGWDYVVARVAIDYRATLERADGAALARCRLVGIGRSSFTTREEVLTPDGRVAAEAEVVIVAWDRAAGRSRPLLDAEREALTRELDRIRA